MWREGGSTPFTAWVRLLGSAPGNRILSSGLPGQREWVEPDGSAGVQGGGGDWRPETLDDEGFEPSTFRMQNGRSTTELNAQLLSKAVVEMQGIDPCTSRMLSERSTI